MTIKPVAAVAIAAVRVTLVLAATTARPERAARAGRR